MQQLGSAMQLQVAGPKVEQQLQHLQVCVGCLGLVSMRDMYQKGVGASCISETGKGETTCVLMLR